MQYYYRQQGPGCGGCLLIAMLLALVTGGAQGLFSFLGTLVYFGITGILILVIIFWGFSFWLQRKVADYAQSQTEQHNRFVWLLVHILIHIAKIDGQITREEITTIHRFFQYRLHYGQTQMAWVKELIKEATASNQSLNSLLEEFKRDFAYEPRLILLELIYQLLYTKTSVPENELEYARKIANFLEIPEYTQRTFEAKYRYGSQNGSYGGAGGASTGYDESARHYATLGLEKGATMDEIKKAYRKLSMQYHPDKVRHLGAEFQKVAEEKMKEINTAYDYFKKHMS